MVMAVDKTVVELTDNKVLIVETHLPSLVQGPLYMC